jgi:hypothetical protein
VVLTMMRRALSTRFMGSLVALLTQDDP